MCFSVVNGLIVAKVSDAVYYMGCIEGVMYPLCEEDRVSYKVGGQEVEAHYVVPLRTYTKDFHDCQCYMYDEHRQKIDVPPQYVLLDSMADAVQGF